MTGTQNVSVSQSLRQYSTCDISDALLKLHHPHGGFLPGLTMWSPKRQEGDTKIVGPAYTVKFVRNNYPNAPQLKQHYIDTIPAGAVVFISAPNDVFNAVYGGLMSTRAKFSGAEGTVIDGRFRDLHEHRSLEYPVFARDCATPAFYEVARPSEINVPVKFVDLAIDVTIEPGDWIVGDLNGVVCIPKDLAGSVVELLPKQTSIDAHMAVAISKGSTFVNASREYRNK